MPTLLHIDASPLGEASISRHLSAEFVRKWQQANPDGKLTTRDLITSGIPPVDSHWMGAVFTPEESRTAAHKETVALSDTLIAELEAADEYVFGVPMHNFSIPSTLKLWIDQIVRLGRTFSYGESGPAGRAADVPCRCFPRWTDPRTTWVPDRSRRARRRVPRRDLQRYGPVHRRAIRPTHGRQ